MTITRCFAGWLAVMSLLCATALRADPPAKLDNVDVFAFGGVGIVGSISPGEKSYREVLSAPDALKQFQATLEHGKPAAQLYALCGIHRLAPATFEDAARTLRRQNPEVSFMAGCIMSHEPAAGIIQKIAAGRYDGDLKKPAPK